jgi:hypothetical protein
MNFLADESCAGPVIQALCEADHDVVAGVILVRFPGRARRAKSATVIEAVSRLGSRLRDASTVVEPGRASTSSRP